VSRCSSDHYLLFVISVVLLPVGVFCFEVQPPPASTYTIIKLPIKPAHISNTGEVVGSTDSDRPAAWTQKNGLTIIPSSHALSQGEAVASNSTGGIIGSLTDQESESRAFVYSNLKMSLLSSQNSKAFAISDAGVIVGQSVPHGRNSVSPVLWENGKMKTIDAGAGVANGINDAGQIVGQAYDSQGRYHAFLWTRTSGLQWIGPAETFSSAITINDSGYIVLQMFSKGSFLYSGDKLVSEIVAPGKLPVEVRALNNHNVAVGAYGRFSDEYRAFRWDQKTGPIDLNSLIPAGSGWKLETASGINDQGQIVGIGDFKGNDNAGFLLTP
jgi:probable HAF family extracellular repeat protein